MIKCFWSKVFLLGIDKRFNNGQPFTQVNLGWFRIRKYW